MTNAKKVMLVDDDPFVAFLTERLLKRLGVETTELLKAGNGQEALEIVQEVCRREQCPELILLDINMPVMDGFGFLEELQKSVGLGIDSIKIVLLSSSTHHLDLAKAKQYPVIACLEKPLTAEALSRYL